MVGARKRPAPFAGFSPFARSLLFSVSSKPPLPPAETTAENADSHEMPPSKRSKRDDPSSDEESYSNSDSDGDDDSSEELDTVQADFAFYDPKPKDFHGVKLLLNTYLGSKPWDLAGFVDLILEQSTVGTVVKIADDDEEGEGSGAEKSRATDDDDLFGLISVLNLARYGEHRCISDLKDYLLAVCGDKDTKKKLKQLLEEKAPDVGLLVCRRFVNFPYELVPKLYDSLFDEVSWATEDEPTQELRDSFRSSSTYWLSEYLSGAAPCLSKFQSFGNCFCHTGNISVSLYAEETPTKHEAKNCTEADEPVIYPKLEDEIFRELCSWSFTFPIRAEQPAQQEMKNYKEMGLVMVVKHEAIPKFRKKLEDLVSE
ncbi:hypothetical protein GUJ93_ZPchr0003g16587 [Zizania palustris]|uniref:Protein BCCIP homolog n=1 Tax=Zizania palustris TaxID=103762 RepID=A0A8J5SUH3_ZIZPA|nr:hypothetical protein GUJ93_ZPchr0003g16587 [Zizania palustris]